MSEQQRTTFTNGVLAGARTLGAAVLCCAVVAARPAAQEPPSMMIRIAEVEVAPAALEAYKRILADEADASVRLEPGVVAIVPMYPKDAPHQVRILEVYASAAAYQAHLRTPHFTHYKSATQHMVRSLRLVDMSVAEAPALREIFRKVENR